MVALNKLLNSSPVEEVELLTLARLERSRGGTTVALAMPDVIGASEAPSGCHQKIIGFPRPSKSPSLRNTPQIMVRIPICFKAYIYTP